ncbi:hypothetical protein CDAR_234571 [Caerostris darwini]|uniref:Uncharacterized protein n=1 Tax=Caerostris darwini TaxID=1538125 RepID=A0AAV4TL72_9ARAC|nr:hypothetical protein CDAR_234571 [Caerostris darwini]
MNARCLIGQKKKKKVIIIQFTHFFCSSEQKTHRTHISETLPNDSSYRERSPPRSRPPFDNARRCKQTHSHLSFYPLLLYAPLSPTPPHPSIGAWEKAPCGHFAPFTLEEWQLFRRHSLLKPPSPPFTSPDIVCRGPPQTRK